jgi:threonine aldolase
MFCLSKGLGAPVGSMLAGTAQDIARARLYRKRLGGGMRQAGVLAAAGLIALEEHPAKLKCDHANAKLLAAAISEMPGVRLDPTSVETNIVIFDVAGTGVAPKLISSALKLRGVLMNSVSDTEMRAVTHYDVSTGDCLAAIDILRQVLLEIRK